MSETERVALLKDILVQVLERAGDIIFENEGNYYLLGMGVKEFAEGRLQEDVNLAEVIPRDVMRALKEAIAERGREERNACMKLAQRYLLGYWQDQAAVYRFIEAFAYAIEQVYPGQGGAAAGPAGVGYDPRKTVEETTPGANPGSKPGGKVRLGKEQGKEQRKEQGRAQNLGRIQEDDEDQHSGGGGGNQKGKSKGKDKKKIVLLVLAVVVVAALAALLWFGVLGGGRRHITLSSDDIGSASAAGAAIVLDIPEQVVEDGKKGDLLDISLPDWAEADVVIPVQNADVGTVAMVIREDGTEQPLRKAALVDEGLKVHLTGDVVLQVQKNIRTFEDVPETAWYWDAVTFVAARGIFNGVSETEFNPMGSMSRAVWATVLYGLADTPAAPARTDFQDVKPGAWYRDGVAWAAEQGLMSGHDGIFSPDDVITREQVAVTLWNMAGKPYAEDPMSEFQDSGEIHSYAKIAMAWAYRSGLVNGKGNGRIEPQGGVSRSEAAAVIMNFCNLSA